MLVNYLNLAFKLVCLTAIEVMYTTVILTVVLLKGVGKFVYSRKKFHV